MFSSPILVFDIETIPDVSGLRKFNPELNYLSDQKIVEHTINERRLSTGSEFIPHYFQHVIVISCIYRDKNHFKLRSLGNLDDIESVIIQDFFKIIEYCTPNIISWNGTRFDLPVLNYRSMIHGLVAPKYWDQGQFNSEFKWNNYINRYHQRHIDLMDLLSMYCNAASASLDTITKLCGFPGKQGMNGNQVWAAYCEGKLSDIRTYCEIDVVNTYLVYCKFQLIRGLLSKLEYLKEINLVKEKLTKLTDKQWLNYISKF